MAKSSLATYIDQIDAVVLRTAGVSIHDLSDQPFGDWFDDGMTPAEAAQLALADNGWED